VKDGALVKDGQRIDFVKSSRACENNTNSTTVVAYLFHDLFFWEVRRHSRCGLIQWYCAGMYV